MSALFGAEGPLPALGLDPNLDKAQYDRYKKNQRRKKRESKVGPGFFNTVKGPSKAPAPHTVLSPIRG